MEDTPVHHQSAVPPDAVINSPKEYGTHEVLRDVAYKRLAIVNVVFIGLPGAGRGEWVLVDAGIPVTAAAIVRAVEHRFAKDSRPAAIIMTHGHFDHVGALETLAEKWDVPVFAHPLEQPYLNGSQSYLPPDPSVGGGLMSLLSPMFPRKPVDVSKRLQTLPQDGSVPALPGWRWIHTPGHTVGHVSLWREADRTLITGDAFITTRQESAYAVLTQEPELHGPPMYFTPDWKAAGESVRRLAALQPETVVTGHGRPLGGILENLARNFDEVAVPKQGIYVRTDN
jgi:glyoxylase-like metal-dependent hydrolase (beta-lactamase superfamily II)